MEPTRVNRGLCTFWVRNRKKVFGRVAVVFFCFLVNLLSDAMPQRSAVKKEQFLLLPEHTGHTHYFYIKANLRKASSRKLSEGFHNLLNIQTGGFWLHDMGFFWGSRESFLFTGSRTQSPFLPSRYMITKGCMIEKVFQEPTKKNNDFSQVLFQKKLCH